MVRTGLVPVRKPLSFVATSCMPLRLEPSRPSETPWRQAGDQRDDAKPWRCSMAIPNLEGIARPKRLIADKVYDADKLRLARAMTAWW